MNLKLNANILIQHLIALQTVNIGRAHDVDDVSVAYCDVNSISPYLQANIKMKFSDIIIFSDL